MRRTSTSHWPALKVIIGEIGMFGNFGLVPEERKSWCVGKRLYNDLIHKAAEALTSSSCDMYRMELPKIGSSDPPTPSGAQ